MWCEQQWDSEVKVREREYWLKLMKWKRNTSANMHTCTQALRWSGRGTEANQAALSVSVEQSRHMCKMKSTKNIITRQQLVENGEVIGAVQQRGAATMESGHSWPMTVANPAQPGRTKLMHSTACEGRPAAAHTPSRHQWLMMSAWAVA